MKSIVDLNDIPETLDVCELMAVKGGAAKVSPTCIFASAVKCTVAGSGVIVQPTQPTVASLAD